MLNDRIQTSRWGILEQLWETMTADVDRVYCGTGPAGLADRHVMELVRLATTGSMSIAELARSVERVPARVEIKVGEMASLGLVAVSVPDGGGAPIVAVTELTRRLVPRLLAEWEATEAVLSELERQVPYPLRRAFADLADRLERRSFLARLSDALAPGARSVVGVPGGDAPGRRFPDGQAAPVDTAVPRPEELPRTSQWHALRLVWTQIGEDLDRAYAAIGSSEITRNTAPLVLRLHLDGPQTVQQLSAAEVRPLYKVLNDVEWLRAHGYVTTGAPDEPFGVTAAGACLVPVIDRVWTAREAVIVELERELPYPISRVAEDLWRCVEERSFHERLREKLLADPRWVAEPIQL
ncbi:hypothetical protein GCM10010399_08600 [Dactylosporangium fulvum]|uniref:Uncharacterized protein n=1 Tax=Dactylosporangium fulvum TaxID=53359 RepID=A0ABY5WAY4_9ACTN|nr:hypothetical protein [Dactylosporangium fulvum]UWP86505.1 hypothetical protein Dfulv_20585 [Dactylosporangium fulvum]